MRQAEKMVAIGKLAAGLAHEIAAPLNVVAGRAEMLRKTNRAAGGQDRNLRIIIDQIGRITFIVRNLLDFARRREPRLRPHNLAEVLDDVLGLLEGEFARAGVVVHRDLDDEIVVLGDPDLLHQVFINLLLNSVHALESERAGKAIWITQRRPREMNGHRADDVTLEIRDSGPGIADHHLERIFEPFFTTKSGGEGTGLGLAVVRGIIEEHGGSIAAGNWEGGAVFSLTLATAPEVAGV
jgi:signal transduction histidine kinase